MISLVRSCTGQYVDNEDRHVSAPDVPFYAVLDGGGGYQGHAADLAIEVLRGRLAALRAAVPRGAEAVRDELVDLVHQANAAVFAASKTPRYRGVGTTLTGFALTEEAIVVAHVGDSRLYCRRSNGWWCATEDHSLVNELRWTGKTQDLTEALADHSTAILRVVGVSEQVEVDTHVVQRDGVSQVFLCTDGLWRPFDPKLEQAAPPDLGDEALLDWAFGEYERGGEEDNATGMLVSI